MINSILRSYSQFTFLLLILFVVLLATVRPVQAASECDALAERIDIKNGELEEAQAMVPFSEQFDNVRRAITVVDETLLSTVEDIGKVNKKIQMLRHRLGFANEELQIAGRQPVWARSVGRIPGMEESDSPISSDPDMLKRVADGLDKASKRMREIREVTQKAKKALDVLDQALEARDASPSQQLEAFEHYFRTLAKTVSPLSDRIPVMGQLVTFYADAIQAVIVPIRGVEEGNRKRDQMLRDLGFGDISYNWNSKTSHEAIADLVSNLQRELDGLSTEYHDAGCGEFNSEPTELEEKIDSARKFADSKCLDSEKRQQVWNRQAELFDNVRRWYPTPLIFDPVDFGDSLDAKEELELARKRHNKWKTVKLTAEQRELHREVIAERQAALDDAQEAQEEVIAAYKEEQTCVRIWLESEASAKAWPRWMLEAGNTDLYPHWYRQLETAAKVSSQDLPVTAGSLNGFWDTYASSTSNVYDNGLETTIDSHVGNRVSGRYRRYSDGAVGKFEGKLSEFTLKGAWENITEGHGGDFELTFAEDGKTFQGTWRHSDGTEDFPWIGFKIDEYYDFNLLGTWHTWATSSSDPDEIPLEGSIEIHEGDFVSGRFTRSPDNSQVMIEGKLTGRTLRGTYVNTTHDRSGRIEWVFDRAGKSFRGKWGGGDREPSHPWIGHR